MNKNKNMSMSLAEQTAMLENYNKVRGERDAKEADERKARKLAKKNGLKYNSGPEKKPVCAYCKEDGHWMMDDNKVVCPTLCEKNRVTRDNSAKKDRLWQNQVVPVTVINMPPTGKEAMRGEVWRAEEFARSESWGTVVGGLKNVGLEENVCVMVPKNGFDALAEEEERMEATREEEEVAWELAKEEEEKKAADKKNSGVWGSVKENHARVMKWLPPPKWTPNTALGEVPRSAPELAGESVEKPNLIRATALVSRNGKSDNFNGLHGRSHQCP